LARLKVESRARRGKSWRRTPEMLSKQEFRVKYETQVTDLGIPRDCSMPEAEWCRGDRAAASEQNDFRFVDVDLQFPLGEIPK
jgi:hypothetical protein